MEKSGISRSGTSREYCSQELGSPKAKLHNFLAFPLSLSQEVDLLFLYAEILRIASSPKTKVHTINKTQLLALNSLYNLHLLEQSVMDTSKTSKFGISNSPKNRRSFPRKRLHSSSLNIPRRKETPQELPSKSYRTRSLFDYHM
jgi:hypothetical protein